MVADANQHEIAHPQKRAFLAAYARNGNVTHAAKAAKIGRRTHYGWLETDPAYAVAFADAKDDFADLLEGEAKRRAYDGVKKPVYQGGQLVGYVREYSDTLLIFTLKGLRPEKYRERHEVQQSGEVVIKVEYADGHP